MATFTKIATTQEVPPGQGKVVEVGGRALAVFNVGGQFHVMDNACLHRGGPLGEGMLDGTTVTCPWHGWEYDVTSGACSTDPSLKVATIPVKIEGSDILVGL
ncbi:MAG: Rieske 2Fe-2S domain-containing protein [Candidatus Omnitrophica bacterium]|nr:Rieske 2Fe-2S domain-containing protein [Candidatus Omnitrophota bacterium]